MRKATDIPETLWRSFITVRNMKKKFTKNDLHWLFCVPLEFQWHFGQFSSDSSNFPLLIYYYNIIPLRTLILTLLYRVLCNHGWEACEETQRFISWSVKKDYRLGLISVFSSSLDINGNFCSSLAQEFTTSFSIILSLLLLKLKI